MSKIDIYGKAEYVLDNDLEKALRYVFRYHLKKNRDIKCYAFPARNGGILLTVTLIANERYFEYDCIYRKTERPRIIIQDRKIQFYMPC